MQTDLNSLSPSLRKSGKKYSKIPFPLLTTLRVEEPSARATARCRRCEECCSNPRVYISLGRNKRNLWTSAWAHRVDNTAYFCLDCFLDYETYEWLNTGAWKTLEYQCGWQKVGERQANRGERQANRADWTIEEMLTSPELTHRTFAKVIMDLNNGTQTEKEE